jgi:hypothetical protein
MVSAVYQVTCGDVVVLGAPSDIEPIRLGGKEIQYFVAGNEMGEDS